MVIADTGFWLALLDRNDSYHAHSVAALQNLHEPLITTTAIITETSHLVIARLDWLTLVNFIKSLSGGLTQLFEINVDHMERIAKLIRKYRDLPMDFADATLVILAEHLGHGRILSTDRRDFNAYRWKERRPFDNLLKIV